MPALFYLLWLLLMVISTPSLVAKRSVIQKIRYIKIQESLEPALRHWRWKQLSNFYAKYSSIWWCHPIKFRCKEISRYGRNSHLIIRDLIMTLNLKTANQFCMTLAHDDASLYQVWLQKVQQLRRYRPDEHSLELWTLHLTFTTREQSNLFTSQMGEWPRM